MIDLRPSGDSRINKLLSDVELLAAERKFTFDGVKKSTKPEQALNGRCIKDVFDNKAVDLNCNLIAGTAWLFARPELDRALDYLFIDEAGQVAVANVVAMGLSARNIVLVGDQMQLSQPIQGVHPGDSANPHWNISSENMRRFLRIAAYFFPRPGECMRRSVASYRTQFMTDGSSRT